jgi:hypothetical protein
MSGVTKDFEQYPGVMRKGHMLGRGHIAQFQSDGQQVERTSTTV